MPEYDEFILNLFQEFKYADKLLKIYKTLSPEKI